MTLEKETESCHSKRTVFQLERNSPILILGKKGTSLFLIFPPIPMVKYWDQMLDTHFFFPFFGFILDGNSSLKKNDSRSGRSLRIFKNILKNALYIAPSQIEGNQAHLAQMVERALSTISNQGKVLGSIPRMGTLIPFFGCMFFEFAKYCEKNLKPLIRTLRCYILPSYHPPKIIYL